MPTKPLILAKDGATATALRVAAFGSVIQGNASSVAGLGSEVRLPSGKRCMGCSTGGGRVRQWRGPGFE